MRFYHQASKVSDVNSTNDAFSHLKKAVKHNIICSGQYNACFIDYEKTFEFAKRNLLLIKLMKLGAPREHATHNTVRAKKQFPGAPCWRIPVKPNWTTKRSRPRGQTLTTFILFIYSWFVLWIETQEAKFYILSWWLSTWEL